MYTMRRRSFLTRSLAALGYGLGAALHEVRGDGDRAGNELRLPAKWRNGDELSVRESNVSIWPGHETSVFAVNGSIPGPTMRINRGETLRSRVVNQLNEPLVIHWHGLLAPAGMDGHPRDAVPSGGSYEVEFKVDQRASTCWYHSHTDLLTAEQVYRGVAGFFIVEDPSEEALGLPTGDKDIPMLLSDWRSNRSYQLLYEPAMMDNMLGYLGDTPMVNGTPEAWLSVDRGAYRFRLLNGSNARAMKVGFDDGRSFHLVGTDGGLLPSPIEVTTAMLVPGQRLDILVDFSDVPEGQSLNMMSFEFPRDGGMHGGSFRQGDEMALLKIYVDQPGEPLVSLPEELTALEQWKAEDAKRTRTFSLSFARMRHYINGRLFDMNRSDFEVAEGELEIWEYRNTTNVFHPMHMHGTHFQVLERSSQRTLGPEDQGWKDTVQVNPNETVRVLVRFEAHDGLFLHHCHNLAHEDAGMMQNFTVKASPEPELDIDRSTAGHVRVSWSAEAEGYRLESSENLKTESWIPVAEVPEVISGRKIVTLPSDGNRFFRLVKPS